ncbi:MAG TPA: phage portal protein [Nevskia sp.]|nr:phage portal protein [Nevskia sp.]
MAAPRANLPVLVDSSGRPLRARADGAPGYPGGDGYARSVFPYEAARWQSQEMGDWLPWIRSPDAEINQFRDRMVARSRDLYRNDGWIVGGIMRILDNTLGCDLRLHASPDYRALQRFSKKFDAKWADDFRKYVEACWRTFAYDVNHFNDVTREQTMGQQWYLMMSHKLVDGDNLAVSYWKPELIGAGAARYATCFQVVDPDRLSNPYQMVDTRYLRGGVELDEDGAHIAYHIRRAHQNDWYNAVESMIWDRVEKHDPDGWQRVFHGYEKKRAGQSRGIGIFAPVIAHMKMLARYYGVELQAATLASVLGTYVTSPYDPAQVSDALDDGSNADLSRYQSLRADWHKERPAMMGGVRVPTLAPGEKIEQVSGAHPHTEFTPFAQEMLRVFAACTGQTIEQVSQDWSKSNYSNLRGALADAWKTVVRRRSEFCAETATPMYATWLAEEFERGEVPLPDDAPSYQEAMTEYSRCGWLGPGRGFIDKPKEIQGSAMAMDIGMGTLKRETAELYGEDWEEQLDQRQIERRAYADRGLPYPSWIGAGGTDDKSLQAATEAK